VRVDRPGVLAALAVSGILGPILFTVLVIVQGLLQPDYSHVALPISALAAWPKGWIQNVNFFVFGFLMIAYAVGLHLGVRPGRGGVIGPVILVLSGVGLEIAGAFPWKEVGGRYVVSGRHFLGAVLSFLGGGIGLVVMSRRMARDPAWRGLARYALVTGTAIIVLFVAFGRIVRAPNAPLHAWAGLVQRLMVALWFTCTVVLAHRLLRVARTPSD
jgi:hypothetical membrane protein